MKRMFYKIKLVFTINNKKSILQNNFIPLIPPDQHKALTNNLSGYLISAAALLWHCQFLREAKSPPPEALINLHSS